MRKNISLKRPAVVSRIAFFALLFVTMAAATLHIGALTAHAAQADLSWTAPTKYTDGTPLTSLIGYKIYTGTSPGNYSQNTDVGNVTSYTLSSLNDATTYYFAVTANNSSGQVSGFSNQVTFTTPALPPPATLYTLTAAAGSGGSITPSGSVVISQGTSQSFSMAPATGYKIAGVTVDGASVGALSSYTFSNVAASHTIAATFAKSSYTLSASAGTGGTISPTGTATVNSGGSQAYTIAPAANYKIAGVTVDGASVGALSSYTFSNVAASHTIAATFAANTSTYTLSASAGTGGTISPAGTATVNSGGSQVYTITPATGYKIAGVTVDGASVGALSSYTFSNVTAKHTIAASFTSASATITSSATWQNQSIASQSGAFTASFDMIPNANNSDAVTGFSAVQAKAWSDVAAVVRFNTSGAIDARNGNAYAAKVVMPYAAGKVYHVRMQINVPNHRYDVYVTAPGGAETQLAAGYAFRTEQAAISALNNLSIFADVGSHQLLNLSVTATVAPTTYTLSASTGTGGAISPAGAATVNSGGSQAYTITPATGYKIAGVTVDGASVGALSSYTFSNVTANHTIAASFVSVSATITSSGTWLNQSIASQSGAFTASFDIVPNANSIDGVTGFAAVQAKAWSDVAAVVRFNTSGAIDARNGSAYAAKVVMPYSAGKVYHVRMQINVPNHRYDVYVTPPGGAETQLAAGYAFRTEQAKVTALNDLGVFSDVGSHQVSNLTVQ